MSSASIAVTGAVTPAGRNACPRARAADRSFPRPAARHPRRQYGRWDRDIGRPSAVAGARRSQGAHRHRRRRGRVDRHGIQRRHDVHRTADRVPRCTARHTARTPGLLRRVRDRLGVPSVRTQLHRADSADGDCRSRLRDVLSADAQLRPAEHSAQVPGGHARPVRDLHRRRRELCAIALRLVS